MPSPRVDVPLSLLAFALAPLLPAQTISPAPPSARAGTMLRIAAVRIVDASGGGAFTAIQPAIDASASGDVVLVRAGSYGPFTLAGKGIAIVEENGAVAEVAGPSFVRDVPADELAMIAGLNVVGAAGTTALVIEDCAGPVRLQRAAFFGGAGGAVPGGTALSIDSVPDIALVACEMFGGDGGATAPGGAGGRGGRALDAGLVLWGATCEGGDGGVGPAGGCSSTGGAAFEHVNGALFAAASFFRGGAGGASDDCANGCGGDGGDGLVVMPSPAVEPPPVLAHLLGNLYAEGLGGAHPCGAPGSAGTPGGSAGGTNDVIAGTARKMLSPTPVRDAAPMPITLHGEPGDRVFLVLSTASAHQWNAGLHGVRLVGDSFLQVALGTVPASGVLVTSLAIPDGWAAPGAATVVHAQPAFVATSGAVWLGNPSIVVVLDHTL